MATESDIFPEISSLNVWLWMTTSAKERSFLRKSYILFLMRFFKLICHSEKDFTRTNTTEQDKLGGCLRRLFLVSTGVSTMSGGSKFPWFNESRCHKNKQIMTPGFRNFILFFRGFRWCKWDGSWGEVSVNQLSEIKPS